MAAAGHEIIAAARQALSDPQLSNAEAVHDLRKALKRWRALMHLLAGPIREPVEEMRREARELMRALAGTLISPPSPTGSPPPTGTSAD